ncbi:MAG: YidC/Oxa1 family membrane protein insertase [Actinomycetota bacterium]
MGFFEFFSSALSAFYAVIPSYGLAIILLTVLVRIILLPLSIKQTRSMREMQRIQPEVKRIQGKYKGKKDAPARQKMNEEMMALYKEHGVNPFGGCFPLLLQFPVLIGLFYVVRTPLRYMGYRDADPGDALNWVTTNVSGLMERVQDSALARGLDSMFLDINQFLGIRLDCSSSAALSGDDPSQAGVVCGNGLIDALPYLVLVLLMGFTTYYQQKQMQARQAGTVEQTQQMQMFGRIMPIMLMVFSYSFPSGVVLYWLTTNVWTIGQQRLMFRMAPPLAPGDGVGDGKAKKKREQERPESAKPSKGPQGAGPEGSKNVGAAGRSQNASKKRRRR